MWEGAGKASIRHFEVVLKISGRCNINCDYCYVFNKGNSAADDSPALLSVGNIDCLVRFLERACQEYMIESLQVNFHGGEPLMMGKRRFVRMCERLAGGEYCDSKMLLTLQTNAILIDDEWIAIFERYAVCVSVSIDGPKHINDRHRLDKKGRGTYDSTVRGLRRLQNAYRDRRLPSAPGVLCVANAKVSGAEIYRHLVDELQACSFDFLIPDDCYKDTDVDPIGIGCFLNEALDEWVRRNELSKVSVRLFMNNLGRLMRKQKAGNIRRKDSFIITVGSEGLIRVDDTLRSTSDHIFEGIAHVSTATLSEILASPQVQEYLAIATSLPDECEGCIWRNVCEGGALINRFSLENRFEQKTVYCQAMRMFLSRLVDYLLNMGVDEAHIMEVIG